MKKRKFKNYLKRVCFENRWMIPDYNRNGDWTILGISKWWLSSTEYSYSICFFGLSMRIWMKRESMNFKN